ncbi:MAG TPA: adenylate kinase [Herpetosiphonaceae bacterium]|nr:adenylate kinase [Herpetosiphonaceae bacterium]
MNVILVGPPGAGKGTQAKALEARLGLKHIASGDLFRRAIREETEMGLLARSFVDRGELVPDEVVIEMIVERLYQPDCALGVIFDGFPRTKEQAGALERTLEEHGQGIDAVIYLTAPRDILLKRIAGRVTCRGCQASYNIYYSPPVAENVCDRCGDELYERSDDNWNTAKHRLEVYMRQTMPLIDHYRDQGILHEVDGNYYIEKVTERLADELRTNGSNDGSA